MRYDHLDMLPELAFRRVGKRMTLEGGGGKSKKPKVAPLMPANVSTGFGTAIADPRSGQYSYSLDPRLAQMRDVFYGGAQGFLPSDQELQFGQDVSAFGRDIYAQGGQYLQDAIGFSPQDAATNYYNRIQELQVPTRATEESRLADTLFKTGRLGAATAYGGGGGYINPEQFGLLTARAQADKALGLEAEQYGRQLRSQDIASALGIQQAGLGNVQTGYGLRTLPYESAAGIFGLGTGIEGLGMAPLEVGLNATQMQLAAQAQQQAINNARASGGKGGGLLGGVLSLGAQGLGAYMGAGGNPLAAAGSLFSNMSQSSGGGGVNLSGYTPSLWGNVGSYGGMPYSWGNIGGGYAY